ncbi:MAG: SH3 domain-containing protein [Desulfobacteraceae bacterium]|nr:SH3 domain-containing protein [Desulfobacteraceae bacterium]
MVLSLLKKLKLLVVLFSMAVFMASCVAPPLSVANDHRHPGPRPHNPPKKGPGPKGVHFYPGHKVRVIPHGHRIVHVGPKKFFYLEGIFYRPGPDHYLVVAAPIGAVVHAIPVAAVTLTIGAMMYYTHNDVYYEKVPNGYKVVPMPEAVIVDEAEPESHDLSGMRIAVNVAFLNVRSGPGKRHPVTRQLRMGDILIIESTADGWHYVKLPDNSFGWVMAKFTIIAQPKAQG